MKDSKQSIGGKRRERRERRGIGGKRRQRRVREGNRKEGR